MGLFSAFFRHSEPKKQNEIEKVVEQLKQWELKHFPSSRNVQTYKEKLQPSYYETYRTDSGESISLKQYRIPIAQHLAFPGNNFKSPAAMILGILKNTAEYLNGKPLTELICEYRKAIVRELNRYYDNCAKQKQLHLSFQTDTLFQDIEAIFCAKLKMLHNELFFCRFDNFNTEAYCIEKRDKITAILIELSKLNSYFSEYMYALTSTEYDATAADLDGIRIKVEAMSEVAEKYMAENCT